MINPGFKMGRELLRPPGGNAHLISLGATMNWPCSSANPMVYSEALGSTKMCHWIDCL